jgi:hypothetical protein
MIATGRLSDIKEKLKCKKTCNSRLEHRAFDNFVNSLESTC